MKKIFNEWQGIVALTLTVILFGMAPGLFSIFRSNGGIDTAYLQALVFTATVFFTGILCVWLAIQMDFKILHGYISKQLSEDWGFIDARARITIFFLTIAFLLVFFILCFFGLPKP